MRYSYITLFIVRYRSKKRPIEVQSWSGSDIRSYIVTDAPTQSYKPTDKIEIDIVDNYLARLAIREDHPFFNVGLLFNYILEHQGPGPHPFRDKAIPFMRDMYTRLINQQT
jgi:hypothetical protein